MTVSLAERQLALIRWDPLRTGPQTGRIVSDNLRTLISADDDSAEVAYQNLENPVVFQGHLFECSAPVVSVIMAAISDGTIPPPNLASVLDLFGRIVGGYPDESEVALGCEDLHLRCRNEAAKGYWALMRIVCDRDPFNAWQIAMAVLTVLDGRHLADYLREET